MKKIYLGLMVWLASLGLAKAADNCGCACCKGKEVCCCNEGKAVKKETKTWALKGVIKEVLAEQKKLRVKHEPIEGLMPAMTMDFEVDSAVVAKAQKGQSLTARLRQDGEAWVLEEVVLGKAP